MEKTTLTKIKAVINELFEKVGAEADKIEISQKEEVVQVSIESSQASLLIGYHGETLQSLQLICGLLVQSKTGEWFKIVLDVNNWRKEREEVLKKMALGFAQKAKFSGNEVIMPVLSASERRIVHLYLSEYSDIQTYSEGEGLARRLIIKPILQPQSS